MVKKRNNKDFFARNYIESWNYVKNIKNFIYLAVGIFLLFFVLGFLIQAPESVYLWIMDFIAKLLEQTKNLSQFEMIRFIFFNNLQSSLWGMILGIFFGVFPIFTAVVNGYLLGFVAALSISSNGILSLWRLFPHGIFELPAVFISLGMGLKLGSFIFQKKKIDFLKKNIIKSVKVFVFIVIPLLIIAALIEGSLIVLVGWRYIFISPIFLSFMFPKRGQLTIFIIIAIIFVGAILVFFAIRGNISQQTLIPETQQIQNFVQECVDETAFESIYRIGQNGGYYFPPNLSTDSGVAIYYKNGQNYMPSKKQVEEEISFFMNQLLFFCTKNFVDFSDLDVNQEEIQTETKIESNQVSLDISYPITISKDNSSSRIEEFKAEIPVRLGDVYDSVAEFMQNKTSNGICLSCLLEISEKNDLYVDMADYGDKATIFIFTDKNSVIKDEEFAWIFANEYE